MKRILLLTFILFLGLNLSACAQTNNPTVDEEETVQYYFPGEHETHEGTWLIWPHHNGLITPEYVDMISPLWIEFTEALSQAEKVHIVAYDEALKNEVIDLLKESDTNLDNVDFVIAETDQFWARDCGPLFVKDAQGQMAILNFEYNGYGRMDKFGEHVDEEDRWEAPEFIDLTYLENYKKDDDLVKVIADHLNAELIDIEDIVLEGGALEFDGNGTVITTESCILNENRNPDLTKEKAEEIFAQYFGATNVIWLEGSPDEDITDGHIDGLLRFVDEKTIVTMTEANYFETYDYTPDDDYQKIIEAKNKDGEAYTIVELPITAEEVEWLGYRANYLNYYAGNEVVLVPVYTDDNDQDALYILQTLYPEHEIIPFDGEILATLGGGVHCVTQQQVQ